MFFLIIYNSGDSGNCKKILYIFFSRRAQAMRCNFFKPVNWIIDFYIQTYENTKGEQSVP